MDVLKGLPLKSHGFIDGQKPNRKLVIHAMSEYLMWDGVVLDAAHFLKKVKLSVHYLIHPNGQITQHLPVWTKGAHAKGHNSYTAGVELLVPGYNTYAQFMHKIGKEGMAYDLFSRQQYASLTDVMDVLVMTEFLDSPHDYTYHGTLDPLRKSDPGRAFSDKALFEAILSRRGA